MRDEQVIKIISENLNMDTSELTRDLDLVNDLQADSLDFITIVSDLEDNFNFKFDDSMMDQIKTVGDLIDYINTL